MTTSSATGKARPVGSPRSKAVGFRSGFTILEILLVLGLIAIITTLFVMNFNVVFQEEEEITAENAFWTAAREARLESLLRKKPVVLWYDEEETSFVMAAGDGGGSVIRRFPVHALTHDGREILVRFVQERPRSELILIRGQLIDTRPIDQVVFYPDGSATSFWLEMEVGGERRQIRVDPWTGAEMLEQSHRPF